MMTQTIIRNAKQGDINEVYLLSGAEELKNPDGNPQKKWWFEAFLKEKGYFYIAEENKNLAGFILAERTIGNILLIQDIFVKKEFRGRGIGHLLMQKLEKEAKNKKIKLIYTYSDVNNKKTPAFYKKLNYEPSHLVQEFLKFLK